LQIFPAGRALDRELSEKLITDLQNPTHSFAFTNFSHEGAAGLFIDLNGDKVDEFVFLTERRGLLYEKRSDHWVLGADIFRQGAGGKLDLENELDKGNLSTIAPKWSELSVGGSRFRVNE